MNSKRITILDGFRFIAILVVIIFHYYTRFQNDKYHYTFGFTSFFSFGNLGVQFFFIISGFVITLTLNKCSNIFEFIKKRFLRLVPAMLVCSIITFAVFNIFDENQIFPKAHKVLNLFFSNTFLSPKFFNIVFQSDINYIDGAYWSLWVEITFYIVAAILYFCDKRHFLRNYSIFTFFGLIIYYAFITDLGRGVVTKLISDNLYLNVRKLVDIFNILRLSSWFLLGIILYNLHTFYVKRYFIFFTAVFLLQPFIMGIKIENILFLIFIYFLFILFIYKPNVIAFLGNKFFSKLGLISYSVYLIHQYIGVLIINKFSPYFGKYNWVIGIFLIILVFSFGLFSYRYLEKPISTRLRRLMFSKSDTVI